MLVSSRGASQKVEEPLFERKTPVNHGDMKMTRQLLIDNMLFVFLL